MTMSNIVINDKTVNQSVQNGKVDVKNKKNEQDKTSWDKK